MLIDYEQGRFWLSAANALATLAVFLYTWVATRDKDNSKHIAAVDERLTKAVAGLSSRMDRNETQMAHMPTQEELSAVQVDMSRVMATQEAIGRDMLTVRSQLNRIEDFLLKQP